MRRGAGIVRGTVVRAVTVASVGATVCGVQHQSVSVSLVDAA
jgi:hypothetical protein